MIGRTAVYVPADWRQALALGQTLPERTEGVALFADISGFTPPLTKTQRQALAAAWRNYPGT